MISHDHIVTMNQACLGLSWQNTPPPPFQVVCNSPPPPPPTLVLILSRSVPSRPWTDILLKWNIEQDWLTKDSVNL